jgi:Uma2 family endonuclease
MVVKTQQRWTVQDLETLPGNGGWERYEIINGELQVTRAPHAYHQGAAAQIQARLTIWSGQTSGQTPKGAAYQTPGVIFSETDAVIPDLIWISKERIGQGLDGAGHFTVAPELIVEVLSPGERNIKRDKETKLKLYSLYGVEEYWIVSWQVQTIECYRCQDHPSQDNRSQDNPLQLVETLTVIDILTSPLLPGFKVDLARIFA